MYFRRELRGAILDPASSNKVRLLFGARQTGKTHLLEHLTPPKETERYDLLDTRLRRRLEADPGAFGRELRALPARVRHVVVDEVQKVPALLDEVQSFHDRAPDRLQIYLTGSSARRLRAHSANLLPGRSHVFHLSPVLQWEAGATAAPGWPFSRAGERRRAGALDSGEPTEEAPPFPPRDLPHRLVFGGLPGIWQEADEAATRTLAAYVENYLEEEIRREALARDVGAFSVFLRLVALESGRALNLAALSQESGVPASSLKNYCDILVDTFTAHAVPPYGRGGRKAVLTTPHLLLFDLGVRNAAAGLPLDERLVASEPGGLFEQWVVLELLGRAALRGRTHRVSFWRTRTGAEVDAVYESLEEDVPVEVKWTPHPHPKDARHLETFLDTYPERARRGVLVCRAERPQQLTERVVALPWDQL